MAKAKGREGPVVTLMLVTCVAFGFWQESILAGVFMLLFQVTLFAISAYIKGSSVQGQ